MHILVNGGGIAGLTFALAASKQAGISKITVFERSTAVEKATLGGGLGLWPASVAAYNYLGVLPELQREAEWMPSPSYRCGDTGDILAAPTDDARFARKFPILCLKRDHLLKVLVGRNKSSKIIDLRVGESVEDFESQLGGNGKILAKSSSGEFFEGDFLIGADGIHSNIRKLMNEKNGYPRVSPKHCNYCYYRACVDVSSSSPIQQIINPFSLSFESWSAKNRIRFGYVPLQQPSAFWFFSVPSSSSPSSSSSPTRPVTPQEYDSLLALSDKFLLKSSSSSSDFISKLVHLTPAASILKTEINKIPNVTKMAWTSPNHRCILIGDACHATAPNLAQGAGLSIEDAIELAMRLGVLSSYNSSTIAYDSKMISATIEEYVRIRKRRAFVVQSLADTVALVGHARPGILAQSRNFFLKSSRCFAPNLHGAIFEKVVTYSLLGENGGVHNNNNSSLFCLPSTTPRLNPDYAASDSVIGAMLARATSPSTLSTTTTTTTKDKNEEDTNNNNNNNTSNNPFDLYLNEKIKRFRTSASGGSGRGHVSVYEIDPLSSSSVIIKSIRKTMQLMGLLPPLMNKEPFLATVSYDTTSTSSSDLLSPSQRWTRGFAVGPDSKTSYFYSSTQFLTHNNNNNNSSSSEAPLFLLEESLPGFWGQFVRFQFHVSIANKTESRYQFCGTSILPFGRGLGNKKIFSLFRLPQLRIPIPQFLAPATEWKEEQLENGWKYEGVIKMPRMFGGEVICGYGGDFIIDNTRDDDEPSQTSQQASGNKNDKKKKRKIIITGGTGLVGRYLIQSLMNSNQKNEQQQEVSEITEIVVLTRSGNLHQVASKTLPSPTMSCITPPTANNSPSSNTITKIRFVSWDGKTGNNWFRELVNDQNQPNHHHDEAVIINLAGVSLAGRWTESLKREALVSRLDSIRACSDAIKKSKQTTIGKKAQIPVVAFLTASGTGIYDTTCDNNNKNMESMDENSTTENNKNTNTSLTSRYDEYVEKIPTLRSRNYRQETCLAIERFAQEEFHHNHNNFPNLVVIPLRIGIVLSASGGFQPYAELAARLGATRFGSGEQYIPWVHVFDAAENIARISMSSAYSTSSSSHLNTNNFIPINVVAPNPVTNKVLLSEYSSTRRFLFDGFKKKYFGIAIPQWILELVLADASCVLLDSCKLKNNTKLNLDQLAVQPSFKYPTIREALQSWECNVDSSNC